VVDGFDALTWIGDLCGLAPSELATAVRRGADLAVLQILAPHEIAPHFDGSVTLVEPESGARLVAGPAALVAHAHELETQRAAFAAALTRRGARFARASSAESFEAAAARLFIP
jgi:hypothetical protein